MRAKGPARKVGEAERSPVPALGMGKENVYDDIAAVANACDADQSCDPRRRSRYIFAGSMISALREFPFMG